MMTRTKARQAEDKLQLTLQELKSCRMQFEQLLKVRDDHKQEFLQLMDKNKKLKNDLSKIYLEYSELLEQNNNLQKIVNGFDQCREEYEEALSLFEFIGKPELTDELKLQLHEAKEYIFSLENNNLKQEASQTWVLLNWVNWV